ncbi:hypothetical protein R3W88_015596 [Solanum pinnatisectum]|uniref:Uncharacterized protein n=1 Tax=Solanum pinnatisectum TaxID=50273 RepID=A0AAV9KVN2_9SOLN|nr:hypothetical protein R3W88_015596 [Solanum pinnatisectum]
MMEDLLVKEGPENFLKHIYKLFLLEIFLLLTYTPRTWILYEPMDRYKSLLLAMTS